jgi:hypothetical protein
MSSSSSNQSSGNNNKRKLSLSDDPVETKKQKQLIKTTHEKKENFVYVLTTVNRDDDYKNISKDTITKEIYSHYPYKETMEKYFEFIDSSNLDYTTDDDVTLHGSDLVTYLKDIIKKQYSNDADEAIEFLDDVLNDISQSEFRSCSIYEVTVERMVVKTPKK